MKVIRADDIPCSFKADAAPFNSLDVICEWGLLARLCGIQFPSWDRRLFHLNKASEFQDYADEAKGKAAEHGHTELPTHLQGQPGAVHPLLT